MKTTRLLIALALGLVILVGSWWVLAGTAEPVRSLSWTATLEAPLALSATGSQADGAARAQSNGPSPLTVHISASQDNTLYGATTSNGAGQYLFAGVTRYGSVRRGLIAFDVAGSIPAGSTILSATLQLNFSKMSWRAPSVEPVALHRLDASWGEGTSDASGEEGQGAMATAGDATWTYRFYSTTVWTIPGGDYSATASAPADVPYTGSYVRWGSTAGMVADVQSWLDSPATNYGWMLLGDESSSLTARRFDSREHPTVANRPVLIVEYAPPPRPVLAASKQVNDPTPHVGERITYTIVVANSGQGDATDVRISDTLPVGLNFVGPVTLDPPGAGTVGAPPILGSGLPVPAGQRITLTFPVTVSYGLALGTQLTNTVSVTSTEIPTPTTGAVAISVSNLIAVTKAVNNTAPVGRETITYTIVVANTGSIDATDVWVSDTLPAGLDLVGSVTLDPPGAGTVGAPPILGSGLSIPAGQRITLTFPAMVARGLALGTRLTNTAAVTSAQVLTPTTASIMISYSPPRLTTHIGPSKDNTLYQHPTGGLSNGAGQHFFVGANDIPERRRGVIAFDIAGSIPARSIIVSATLQLHMSKTRAGLQPVTLHRLLADWGEGASDAPGSEGQGASATLGDATWLHTFYDIDLWTMPGGEGDYSPAASATTDVDDTGFYRWGSTAKTAADVQAWLDDPATNFGWLLLGNEGAPHTTKRFDSREHPIEANRPVLIVEFVPPPRLTVSKRVNNPAPHVGERITYTIVVANSGQGDAISALVSDTLPTGLNLVGPVTLDPPDAGTVGAPPILGSGLLITAGQRITLTFPVTVGQGLAMGIQVTNTAAVTSARVSTPATGAVAISVRSAIAVTKTVNKTSPVSYETITYTIAVANNGLVDATDVLVSDTLPAGLNFVGPVTLDPPGAGTVGAPPILGSGLFITAGQRITLTFPVTVGQGLAVGTRLVNTAAVTSAHIPTPVTGSVEVSISSPIAVTKTVNKTTAVGGETITYTIVVANNGLVQATDVLVSDTLPAGINFVGPVTLDPPGAGTVGAPPILGSGLSIPAGQRITLTFPVTVDKGLAVGTQVTNTVSVTSAQVSTPATGAVAISINRPMTAVKMVSNATPVRGETITYTIAVANNGLVDAADVLVSDTLPVGINFVGPVTLDPPGAGTVGAPPILGSGLSISAGHSITLTFSATVGQGLAVGTQLTNTAAVTSAQVPTQIIATVTITVDSAGGHVYLPVIFRHR